MAETNKLTSDDIKPGPFSKEDLRRLWRQQADPDNDWDSLGIEKQLAWAQTQALSSKGWIVPSVVQAHVPPAEGEGLSNTPWAATKPPTEDEIDKLYWIAVAAQAAGTLPSDSTISLLTDGYGWDETERRHCLAAARAALARWGLPAVPPPPADGEVLELVQWLNMQGVSNSHRFLYSRVAELLLQCHPAPVAVSDRLPDPGVKVLAHYFNDLGKGRTICAIWVPAKSQSADDPDLDDITWLLEYDEITDNYYLPEGWYEAIENSADLGYVKIYEGEIIYWQSLPKWPAHDQPRENQP